MWFSYLLLHVWSHGSVRLPLMALVYWIGKRWKRLHFVTIRKRRWLLIWGWFGFLETVVVAGLLFATSNLFPGWAGRAAQSVLYALHLDSAPMLVEFMIGFLFGAIGQIAIGVAFAALVWWIFSLYPEPAESPRTIALTQRYAIALLASVCALGIANRIYSRPPKCYDCSELHGIPFAYFQEGPWGIDPGFVWSGVAGDAVVVIAVSVIAGWIWNRMSQSHAPKAANS